MSWRTEALLLVNTYGYKRVAEIGVWKGDLSRMLYKVVDTLILVDPWTVENINFPNYICTMNEPMKTQDELDQMYESVKADMPNAIVYRAPSMVAVEQISDRSLDFVYIDGVHLYEHVRQDIASWLPKVKLGGMIAGDDYNLHAVGLAVNELIDNPQTLGKARPDKRPRTWYKKV